MVLILFCSSDSQATPTTPKKPSPLGPGSPSLRASPFKRPASPLTSSNGRGTGTASVPSSPRPTMSPLNTRHGQVPAPESPASTATMTTGTITPRPEGPVAMQSARTAEASQPSNDPLSKLSVALVREMRESFQVLDRDNDGIVKQDDVVEVLNQLGLDASPAAVAPYFARGTSTLNLSTFLSQLANPLAAMSRLDELAAAFSAFDPDDSGQADADELRTALLRAPALMGGDSVSNSGAALGPADIDKAMDGFLARRAFGKLGGNGSSNHGSGGVFRYGDFLAELQGGSGKEGGSGSKATERSQAQALVAA